MCVFVSVCVCVCVCMCVCEKDIKDILTFIEGHRSQRKRLLHSDLIFTDVPEIKYAVMTSCSDELHISFTQLVCRMSI